MLNLVFQIPFHTEWDQEAFSAAVIRYLADLSDLKELLAGTLLNEDDRKFIEEETAGTFANLCQIDVLIEERLKDWELGRIARVDLALLRLAVYEIWFSSDISTATAINEAVELAKLYGTDESPAFVNGVLGQAALALSGSSLSNG